MNCYWVTLSIGCRVLEPSNVLNNNLANNWIMACNIKYHTILNQIFLIFWFDWITWKFWIRLQIKFIDFKAKYYFLNTIQMINDFFSDRKLINFDLADVSLSWIKKL